MCLRVLYSSVHRTATEVVTYSINRHDQVSIKDKSSLRRQIGRSPELANTLMQGAHRFEICMRCGARQRF